MMRMQMIIWSGAVTHIADPWSNRLNSPLEFRTDIEQMDRQVMDDDTSYGIPELNLGKQRTAAIDRFSAMMIERIDR